MSGPFGSSSFNHLISSGFYNGVATQSLRSDRPSGSRLSQSMGTPTARRRWTISFWIKKTQVALGVNATNSYVPLFASANRLIARFDINDKFQMYDYDGNFDMNLVSSRQFRDTSAWYNIVVIVDIDGQSGNDRAKLYVNGVREAWSGTNPADYDPRWNENTLTHYLIDDGQTSARLNGYVSDVTFLDGTAVGETGGYLDEFGELKNGVWIPKDTSGLTFGNNGFKLEFKNTSVGSGASDTIGADTSGNDNHWDSTNIASTDCNIADSPENNMCTLHAVGRRYGGSYADTELVEGGLKVETQGNATHTFGTMAINNIASQGGVYFEIRLDSQDVSRTYLGLVGDNGANNKNSGSNNASYSFPIKALLRPSAPDGSMGAYFGTNESVSMDLSSHNSNYSDGDVVGVAILSDGKTFFHKNGTYLDDSSGNVGNPSTGANPIGTIDLTEGDWVPYVGYNSSYTVNFGQDGTFNGNETPADTYTDANGIGLFNYPVPTNCLAICTENMAEPTIGPNSATQSDDHFNTVLYTGNDADDRAITGVGFQPDWIWIKNRDNTHVHILYDSSRGLSGGYLTSVNTNTESGTSSTLVKSFDTDGFTLGTSGAVNGGSTDLVSWNWKANGGTTVSDGNGSITSTVQANTKAGFSIVLYTGTGASNATIGHGLGAVPQWILVKNRDAAYNWKVYHAQNTTAPETDYLVLDTDDATADASTHWNDTAPSSTVFTIGSSNGLIRNNDKYIAYCFANVDGFSKFGGHEGNNNSDGTFVYTGFSPAWVMVKNIDTAGENWHMFDNKRNEQHAGYGGNVIKSRLIADDTTQENNNDEIIDFLSNGFKWRDNNAGYNSNASFIYMAFAEAPFKYANAR